MASGTLMANGDAFVKKSGDTMTGNLTLKRNNPTVVLQASEISKGTIPKTAKYNGIILVDNSGTVYPTNYISQFETAVKANGDVAEYLRVHANSTTFNYGEMGINVSQNGTAYGYAPTPVSTSDNSTKIATTAWVRNATGNIAANAATATRLNTARTIQTNLASTVAGSFNGTANITPGVTGVLPVANGGTGSSVFPVRYIGMAKETKYTFDYNYSAILYIFRGSQFGQYVFDVWSQINTLSAVSGVTVSCSDKTVTIVHDGTYGFLCGIIIAPVTQN